jgi:hypothetical protein
VERRLAAYQPIETDPAIVAEMQLLVRSGMSVEAPLPEVPASSQGSLSGPAEGDTRRRSRRFAR